METTTTKLTWAWYGLLILCSLDMASSAYWLQTGLMTEANPFLANCYAQGLWVFLLVKTASFLPALLIIKSVYQKYTRTAKAALIAAFWFYLGGWIIGTVMPFITA